MLSNGQEERGSCSDWLYVALVGRMTESDGNKMDAVAVVCLGEYKNIKQFLNDSPHKPINYKIKRHPTRQRSRGNYI